MPEERQAVNSAFFNQSYSPVWIDPTILGRFLQEDEKMAQNTDYNTGIQLTSSAWDNGSPEGAKPVLPSAVTTVENLPPPIVAIDRISQNLLRVIGHDRLSRVLHCRIEPGFELQR
jgi:hypothetical protein